VLLLEQLTGELGLVRGEPSRPDWPRVIVRTWQELLQAYPPVAPSYWIEVLAPALDRYPQLRSQRPAPGATPGRWSAASSCSPGMKPAP
jgi:hypothetical protein